MRRPVFFLVAVCGSCQLVAPVDDYAGQTWCEQYAPEASVCDDFERGMNPAWQDAGQSDGAFANRVTALDTPSSRSMSPPVALEMSVTGVINDRIQLAWPIPNKPPPQPVSCELDFQVVSGATPAQILGLQFGAQGVHLQIASSNEINAASDVPTDAAPQPLGLAQEGAWQHIRLSVSYDCDAAMCARATLTVADAGSITDFHMAFTDASAALVIGPRLSTQNQLALTVAYDTVHCE